MRIFGIILCLVTLVLTSYSALTYKAPEIEADLRQRTSQAISALAAGDEIGVSVDGRRVTLDGAAADDAERQRVLRAAADVPGVLEAIDGMDGKASTSSYRFGAVKDQQGSVTVEGFAPTDELQAMIEADARAIFGNDASIDIEVAGGAPEGDWQAVTGPALDALATLRQGRLSITGDTVLLKGLVNSEADVEAVEVFAGMMPEGFSWSQDLSVGRPTVEPFTFAIIKDGSGSLRLEGFAPDDATRTLLIDEAEAVSGDRQVIEIIAIADGMPDPEWPALVQAGIGAMQDIEIGRIDVVDNDVSFSSDIETAGEMTAEVQVGSGDVAAELDAALAPAVASAAADAAGDGQTASAPGAGTSSARTDGVLALTINKTEEGAWSMRGAVPDRETGDRLIALLKDQAGVEDVEAELDLIGGGRDGAWMDAAADRLRTLDEVRAGQLTLEGSETSLIGVVATSDEIEPTKEALLAIDPSMKVDLQPVDPRPVASLDIDLSIDGSLVLQGALPNGLSESDALAALGVQNHDGELGENGRGSAETWLQALKGIGAVLPAFERIDLSLGGERPVIEGEVHAVSDADQIGDQLLAALGDDPEPLVEVTRSSRSHPDGSRRISPLTGQDEIHRGGYWLPVMEIDAGRDVCQTRSQSLLDDGGIRFLRGKADLDSRAETVLNALAALAMTCLDRTDLILAVGGHTDSRGAAEMNRELSQARADAVVDALTARGVDPKALRASGYGDQRPIADNASEEGRAANRRITFDWMPSGDWSDSGDLEVTGAEG